MSVAWVVLCPSQGLGAASEGAQQVWSPCRAPPALTSCLEAAELMLMSLQPAWHGERYSTPSSPQTGWKMESGHKQSLRQAGGCGRMEFDVLPAKQEVGDQTQQTKEIFALLPSMSSPPGRGACASLSASGQPPSWDLNCVYWSRCQTGCCSVLMAPLLLCH